MSEFFKFIIGFFYGLRRRIGFVTLVLALVFTGGWIRSLSMADVICFPARKYTTQSMVSVSTDILVSAGNSLVWARDHEETTGTDANQTIDLGSSFPTWQTQTSLPDSEDSHLKWRWRTCGFGICDSEKREEGSRSTCLFIPYWSIAIPLTLVSIFLILIKPRKSTSNKIAEPIAARA